MSIFSGLPAVVGTKAATGIAVAVLAAGTAAAAGVSTHHSSAPQQLVLTTTSTSTSTSESDSSTGTPAPTANTTLTSGSSTSSSSHGDAVTSAVAACKAMRGTSTGPQPPSGHSKRGIGQCVKQTATSQSSTGSSTDSTGG